MRVQFLPSTLTRGLLAVLVAGLCGCASAPRDPGLMAMDEEAWDEARDAEVALATSQVWGVAEGVHEVGTRLVFTFWSERGALTLTGYQALRRDTRAGAPTSPGDTRDAVARALTELGRRPPGEVYLTLRREDSRWQVEQAQSHTASRPLEGRPMPLRHKGIAPDVQARAMEKLQQALAPVAVPHGGAAWVSVDVKMEDGRLVSWRLRDWRATRGAASGAEPVAPRVLAEATHVLLLHAQALGPRVVHLELRLSTHAGASFAGGWVEQTRVDSEPLLASQ
ncbi:hypothetical protein KRR26_16895 [Corallococcus sp. M34]|uniref:hypothetical protein n=1 Tax=Citreicoccus inhibens TaxID=2849499 RepID=UPI001C250BF2|nr:hypothetical protein [Citreicoccus inhibens]MBU8897295.1 hypothetical protein [Citreicoccus inhibens]